MARLARDRDRVARIASETGLDEDEVVDLLEELESAASLYFTGAGGAASDGLSVWVISTLRRGSDILVELGYNTVSGLYWARAVLGDVELAEVRGLPTADKAAEALERELEDG